MEGNESSFIAFRKNDKAVKKKDNFPIKETVCKVDTAWKVTFEAGKRGPEAPNIWPQLIDWINSEDDKIKYFSGQVIYETTFTLEELPRKKPVC